MTDSYGNAPRNQNKRSKGKGSDQDKRKLLFGDYRFVRLELTTEERDDARASISNSPQPLEVITGFLDRGYTVKFSVDAKGGGCLCSVTNTDPESADGGLILTGRGATALVAWNAFLYKDLVICADRGWKQTEYERGGSYQDIG